MRLFNKGQILLQSSSFTFLCIMGVEKEKEGESLVSSRNVVMQILIFGI